MKSFYDILQSEITSQLASKLDISEYSVDQEQVQDIMEQIAKRLAKEAISKRHGLD